MSQLLDELREALRDGYRVDAEVGRGGMATVFVAEDLKHGRRVAIKVVNPELSSSIDADRFTREIQIAARLSHPHILPVHDSGVARGLHYYVMPFVQGESLRQRLDRESQLSVEDALQITCEVADALAYAHENHVVHRDIKPENILLYGGHAVVADFGIARVLQDSTAEKLTATGVSVGTVQYMSPEQFAGGVVDGRSDMYSLACVLYEMLVGEVPFTGPNAMAIVARHAMDAPPPIRVVRPAVPQEIEAAVMHALEKVPADRFPGVAQFKAALLGEATSSYARWSRSYTGAAPIAAVERERRPRRGLLVAIAAVVLAASGAYATRHYLFGSSRTAVAADADARRLAVLYFHDESRDGHLRYLADGLTESLIDNLSQVPVLDVLSRNAVRPFRGEDVTGDSVARALKVGTIVRGEVEPRPGGVKVTVRLVDAAADVDIAHKSVEVDSSHVVSLQGEVAGQVAEFLRQRLGEEVKLREERETTRSAEAWTLVQRAERQRLDADSLLAAGARDSALASLGRADSALTRAAAADPTWSKPRVLQARIDYMRVVAASTGANPMVAAPVIDSGLAHAAHALAIDAASADAFEVRGELLYARSVLRLSGDQKHIDADLAAAESTLKKAVTINRDQAGAWATLSSLYYHKPDLQEAIRAAEEAYRADAYLASARTILQRLFWTNHDLEYYPEAWKYCDEGRRRFPRDPFFVECRLWMYTTRFPSPAPDSAWAWYARYVALTPANARAMAEKHGAILVAGALARASLADSARHLLARSRGTPELDPKRELAGDEAIVRVILGDQDEAVRLLQEYLTANPDHRRGFATRVSPWWRDLQGNPKFQALIAGAR